MNIPSYRPGQRRFSLISSTEWGSPGSYNYTVKAGTTHLSVEMWGGGGGGGGGYDIGGKFSTTWYGGDAGGSGGYTYIVLEEDFKKGDVINFTIGTGGTAGVFGFNGGDGGNTTLNTYKRGATTLVTYSNKIAGGGKGGYYGGSVGSAGQGGTTTGGIYPSSAGDNGPEGSSGVDVCAVGGDGPYAPMYLASAMPLNGDCGEDAALNGEEYGDAGRGGPGGVADPDGIINGNGGNGAYGYVRIKAYGYYPPVPKP